MKSLIVLCVLLLSITSLYSQQSKESNPEPKAPLWSPLRQNSPSFPVKMAATGGIQAQGLYGTDYLTVSNYGQPGVLIMGLGDEFNGVMATYLACHIWAILGQSGSVSWGDGTPDTPIFFVPPVWSRQAGTIKTPQKSGVFPVTVTITNQCGDWWRHSTVTNGVRATATAYVYQSIPISSLQINCAASSPCPTVKGGLLASGVVNNTVVSPSTGLGTLVLISVTGPATTVPYIIETVGLQTVSFDIQTTPVTANTPLMVSVYSGGTTVSQTITVTP
jgi:hypothetical protein